MDIYTSRNDLPERTSMVFEHGCNLCRLIKTLQDREKIIYFSLTAEDRNIKRIKQYTYFIIGGLILLFYI